MIKLGDSHNYGKFVFEENNKIYKPRPLLWEYLFLSNESILRKFIHQQCLSELIPSPFNIAPNLIFAMDDSTCGHVEKLSLRTLTDDYVFTEKDFNNIGALMALCYWFGISDLHKENIKIGLSTNSELTCFPIDIECILNQLTHIHQTILIPSEKIDISKCGLSQIWNRLLAGPDYFKISLLKSFIQNINLYNKNHKEIFNSLRETKKIELSYIRIIPRNTKDYLDLMLDEKNTTLFNSERVQLTRKEIPYFFRYPNDIRLMYFSENNILFSEFTLEDFELSSAIKLIEGNEGHLIKLKNAILSVSDLAKKLNLKQKSEKLGHVNITSQNEVLSVEEKNGKITFINI